MTRSHLTREQRRKFRRVLEDELETLLRRMAASEDTVRPVKLDPGAVGRLSRMDEIQSQMMSQSLRDRESHRLVELQRALERMERKAYGICERCGGEISLARLEAFPETSTCRACSR